MKFKKTLIAASAMIFGSAAIAGSQCDLSNLSAWSLANNPASMLTVTNVASMGGTQCGLSMEAVNQPGGQSTKHFVQDSSPAAETRYRAAFCIDPNTIGMATSGPNRRLKVHIAQCTGVGCQNSDVVQFKLENVGAGYQFRMYVRDLNTGNTRNTHTIPINDEPTRVEYDLDLANDTFRVWINATSEADVPVVDLDATDIDLSAWAKISRARLGTMDRSGNVTAGDTFFIDEFESRRQTFIGGTCL